MTNLWAVNSLGKVYTLSTADERWEELKYEIIDFKKVAAHEFFTWAIGGDHQIYIFVPTRDVPIRCRVMTYENERWNPISGFCSKLLPTDRPRWSSTDGLVALPQEGFQLPSQSWEWEEEWYVEDNLDGQPLEPEGWTYAADFPAKYGPSKIWNSCVRRRKWIRYRRYCATSKWSLIPSIHEDPVLEPFIDISIGGVEIPGGESTDFTVWAITIMGRVLFRYGVTQTNPEGNGWVPVKTPEESDVSQVSVGPTGLTWAVSWNGNCLVRTGVTRENMMGNAWVIVDPPGTNDVLTQISVGKNVVWALSKEHKVWFRKGIDGLHSGENVKDATGSGWIEMVGSLSNISIGIDDQVFGVNMSGSELLFRTGVNSSELFGRTWKVIESPLAELCHSPSTSSLGSVSISSHRDSVITNDSISIGASSLNSRKTSGENYLSSSQLSGSSLISSDDHCESKILGPDGDVNCNDIQGRERTPSIIHRTGSYSSLDVDVFAERSMMFQPMVLDPADLPCRNVMWMWISAGGCMVNPDALPYWFSKGSSKHINVSDEPWYPDILSQLKDRYSREVMQYTSYPRAIEKSTWVKSVACRWLKNNWENCHLELIQHGDNNSKSILTWHRKKDQITVQLSHITCVACLPDWGNDILVIYTAKKTIKGSAYKFSFTSNDDLEDWLATLNFACHSVHNLPWKPEKTSIWSLTNNGGVFVHCSSPETGKEPPVNMKWWLLGGGHLRSVETCPAGITWGLGYNCIAWSYTGGFGGGPYHGVPGRNALIGPMSDTRCLYIYENQRWNPLTGFTARGLPTDRYMWSDETGRIECTKDNTHLPSGHWQWTTDWTIDFKNPGGVDNEGWQYATDFPRSYHGYKRITDYVRRRRWYRKCKLNTTGPWKQLGSTPLLDISFQMDSVDSAGTVAVWAVAINGDVLFRNGVTEECPTGLNWLHVKSEKPFCSISVGGNGAVWGIARDGSAQLRHGITNMLPTGQYWCHIEPPQVGSPLRQVSAGKTVVLAVDDSNRLWSRQEIVPIFREGTHWKLVSEDVKQVSVGPMNQVWCVKSKFATPSGTISGVVCRRTGISEDNLYGTDWEQGIGGCWSHISIRGCLSTG